MADEIRINRPSNASALIGVLLILISIAVYAFLTRSISADVANVETKLENRNETATALNEEIEKFESAEDELGLATEVERVEAKKSIPLMMDQDEVIRDLLKISENNDVTLNSLSFGQGGTEKEGIQSLRVNASFEGNFLDLTSFLRGLEQNARLLVVKSISVQVNLLALSGVQRANFTLAIESFYQG